MKGIGLKFVTFLLAAAASQPVSVSAQVPAVEAPAAQGPGLPFALQFGPDHSDGPLLRVGQNYTLKAGDEVRDVAVIFGDATIEGRVDGDVLVVLGTARLASTASIDGNLVVIGGATMLSEGAQVRRDLVAVGTRFDAPAGFTPGGAHIVIGPASLGGQLDAFVPWLTRGLLWGRLIVPSLPWIWAIVGVLFLVYLALNLVFDHPVRACAVTLQDKPLTAFVVGLLVMLLTGPVCLLLAVSVVGLAVVPFVICALFVAALIGKVGVARWIGMRVVPQPSLEGRLQSLRSFIIGFVVIMLAYMVPVLGFVAWTMVGLLGLGAATLAFISAYRQENPARPRRAAVIPTPVPVAVPDYNEPAPLPDGGAPAMTAPVPPIVSDVALMPRAGFRDRLVAFVLDVILVVVAGQLMDLLRRDGDSAFFLLLLGYHVGFWAWKGTTVGGIICQLRVVRVDGSRLRFVDALVRGLSAIFSLAVLAIGCLWMIWDPDSQAWHDKIAGTYVVKVPRNWPL